MIDLDRPARNGPPEGRWRRLATARSLVLIVVGSLLAGGVLGCVATYLAWYRPLAASVEQADQAESSAVSVLLFADSGVRTVDKEQRRVRIDAQVTVVNAGPALINVLAVGVDQPGVTVRSPEKERQIEPGTASPVDVVVEWDCGADQPEALVASVSVETADEQARTAPADLDGASWIESRSVGCAGLG
jgi:hypothetical protein